MDLFGGDGHVLDAAGDDDEFAFADEGIVVAEFHLEGAFHDEEHFVFVIVVVPEKIAFEFHELDEAIIHFACDFRAPVFLYLAEFLRHQRCHARSHSKALTCQDHSDP